MQRAFIKKQSSVKLLRRWKVFLLEKITRNLFSLMYKVTWGNVEIIDNSTSTKFGSVKRRQKPEPCRQSFIRASMEMFALIYISFSCTPFTNIERGYLKMRMR